MDGDAISLLDLKADVICADISDYLLRLLVDEEETVGPIVFLFQVVAYLPQLSALDVLLLILLKSSLLIFVLSLLHPFSLLVDDE